MNEEKRRFVISPVCYTVLYQELVPVAKEHGYALAVHGSMTRDFDLVAVPWIDDASEPQDLVRALREKVHGIFHSTGWDELVTDENMLYRDKPHGRLTCPIHLTDHGCYGPYIDLSIIQKMPKNLARIGKEGGE